MKSSRVFWGIFFILFGILLLADRFDVFSLDLGSIWRFWPVILILVGGSLLFRSPVRWVFLSLGAVCGAMILASVVGLLGGWGGVSGDRPGREQHLTIPRRPGIERASFRFDGGAGTLRIAEGEGELARVETRTSMGEYTLWHDSSAERDEVSLTLEGSNRRWRIGRIENHVEAMLHPEPIWDLDLKLGAASVNLDLRRLAVERLAVECGASTFVIRLGDRVPEAEVEVNAGASSIRIEVPESAGCRVRVEAPLSGKRLPGFEKVGKGEYETENFSSAEKKISLLLHAGVSSIRVTRVRVD